MKNSLGKLFVLLLLMVGFSSASVLAADIPADAPQYNGHYYYKYSEGSNIEDAIALCERVGGHLATIDSADENKFILDNLKPYNSFIGLTDGDNQGVWHWYNGEATNYLNWDDFPSSSGDWAYVKSDGKWFNGTRYSGNSFLCEWDVGSVPNKVPTPAPGTTQVPADAPQYNGHYYYKYSEGSNIEDAIALCERVGGHLATIDSADENKFVLDNLKPYNSFIGLTDSDNQGVWHWYNGEATNYLNWDGFPSSSGDWAYVKSDGKWFNGTRYSGNSFLCEWDMGSAPAPSPSPSNPTPSPSPETPSNPTVSTVSVYRLYTPVNGEHLYTTDYNEVQYLSNNGWNYEGVCWNAPSSGEAVYRLYSPITNAHLYTSDQNEISTLTRSGAWNMDNNGNPMFYSGGSNNVYRLYSQGLRQHLLTTNTDEYNQLSRNGWDGEGVKFHCQ